VLAVTAFLAVNAHVIIDLTFAKRLARRWLTMDARIARSMEEFARCSANLQPAMYEAQALAYPLPPPYVVNTAGLRASVVGNELVKYADDTYLNT
jgi:hypothetical protein